MKVAYFDTIGGIAGDMTLSAFVSAGLPLDELTTELRRLPLQGFELTGAHVKRNGIDAVHIDVVVTEQQHPHRHLRDILALLEKSTLSPATKERAESIFTVLAQAEAAVHHTTPDKVHFHEVGGVDSIIDIVGTAVCLERFDIQRVYTSPVRLGQGGLVMTEHGKLPTPTPATLEILRDYPTVLTSIPHELTTPTGAAIVKALSSGVLDEEVLVVQAIGYGAGTREIAELPNLLRLVVAEVEADQEQDQAVLIETNIDDMNPQVYPYIIEKVLASGAHDAYLIPVIMKKGRPGMLLSVLADRPRLNTLVDLIYDQTSTIGLRVQYIGRQKLPRRHVEIDTSFGKVKAKVALRNGRETISPEFEECKRIAEEKGLPLLDVMRTLEQEIARGNVRTNSSLHSHDKDQDT
jgi:uncharacterized protein (TIGR00299 family) protein